MASKGRRGGSPNPYTPPSYRGALLMLVVSLVVIVLLWWLYGQAASLLPGSVETP